MPAGVGISPIFNVADIYPFTIGDTGQIVGDKYIDDDMQWLKQMAVAQQLEAEDILDTKIAKSTRQKDYLEYLVKWKENPVEDSTWMSAAKLEVKGFAVADLLNTGSILFTLGVSFRGI